MRRFVRAALHNFRRLRLAQSGVAAVEFALVVPILLLIYVGTIEASALISVDRKVQSVSGALGDLVSRTENTLPASDLRDYFRAASGIMSPYPASGVYQVVTVISVSESGTTSVAWSREFTNGNYQVAAAHPVGSTYAVPQEMIDISRGSSVIAAEARYTYTPFFGIVIGEVNLGRSSFFAPRFPGGIALN